MSVPSRSVSGTTRRMAAGSRVGRSPWTLTMRSKRLSASTSRSASKMRSVPEGRSGSVRIAVPRRPADGVGDRRLGAGHDHRPEGRLDGAAPHMDDHRLAGDVGQRLVGQAGRGQAGRDEDVIGWRGVPAVKTNSSRPAAYCRETSRFTTKAQRTQRPCRSRPYPCPGRAAETRALTPSCLACVPIPVASTRRPIGQAACLPLHSAPIQTRANP